MVHFLLWTQKYVENFLVTPPKRRAFKPSIVTPSPHRLRLQHVSAQPGGEDGRFHAEESK